MAFEDDVAAAKASGRPFRVELSKDGGQVVYLTAREIAEAEAARAAAQAREDAEAAKQQALFSAAAAIAPLPSPHQRSLNDIYDRFEDVLAYLRLKHPEDSR